MASNRRPRRTVAQINVVPYIDVMLVLLVIFMVTAPMLQPGIVNLPRANPADRQIPQQPLTIEIEAGGQLRLDDAGKKQAVANVASLQGLLAAQADRPVLIAGDGKVPYEKVLEVMSAIKKADPARRVGLMVDPR